jgi:hypothetical protein
MAQLTKNRPEGHNHTASFGGKLTQETNCQIKRQLALTFISVILPLWQNFQRAHTLQNART